MDLSNIFKIITHFLLINSDNLKVFIYKPHSHTGKKWIFVISNSINNERISGTGSSKYLFNAYLRSLSELGEEIIRVKYNMHSRSGLAGGLRKKNILNRCKSELVERDSFFFHYRKCIPFQTPILNSTKSCKDLITFELSSKFDSIKVALVTKRIHFLENKPFVHFGTGANSNWETAIKKAEDEYYSLLIFFEANKKLILSWVDNNIKPKNVMYLHLLACFDERNIEIFKKLCSKSLYKDSNNNTEKNDEINEFWEIEKFNSPIKFFQFYKVENSNLTPIVFGGQEFSKNSISTEQRSLYHPFW